MSKSAYQDIFRQARKKTQQEELSFKDFSDEVRQKVSAEYPLMSESVPLLFDRISAGCYTIGKLGGYFMSFDGLAMSALVCELNKKLCGGRIDKIFQPEPFDLVFSIRLTGENIRLLLASHPEQPRLCLTDAAPANPPAPPAFCMLLRKYLEDGRISTIRQQELDRVILIDIDTRGERGLIVTYQLIIEVMGKHSNIILVKDGVILDAIRRIGPALSRQRLILPGKPHICPPGHDRLNILSNPPIAFIEKLQEKTGLLTKAIINTAIGIGPVSAREMLFRANLPENMLTETMSMDDYQHLAKALTDVASYFTSNNFKPAVILDTDKRLLAITAFPLLHLSGKEILHFSSMSEAVNAAYSLKGTRPPQEKHLLNKLLHAEIAKLERKQVSLQEELSTAQTADEFRQKGDILMANLYRIPQLSAEVQLEDFYSDKPESLLTITLDPLLSPVENANSYYHRYNKFKRAQESLAVQLTYCADEIIYLGSIQVALDTAFRPEEFAEIRSELATAGYLKEQGKRRPAPAALTLLQFKTSDGFFVQAGKNNRQNDHLTLKLSQSDDYWLHTKDIPGSHVLISSQGQTVTATALQEAAQIAAYYSKARQSAKVPVDYTKRRFVRKPAGAKPGFVIYDHQSTLYVTPDENFIKSLECPKRP